MKRLRVNKKEMSAIRGIVFALIVSTFLIGCIQVSRLNFEQDRQNAVTSTDKFHDLFSDRKFEEIYNLTDEKAQKTKSKEGLISILAALRNERGAVIKSDLIDSKVEVRALYREVHLSFRAKFENTETNERFVWYVSNEKAGLFSYETD